MEYRKAILSWLSILCLMVFAMVVIGGVTRLTGSGLSMVEWKPLMGIFPPLTEAAWLEVFNKYKQYPEYQILNQGMSLSEFQFIFFWEYLHRILGRLIGVVFFFPFVFFLWKGALGTGLRKKLFIGFILGGLQGLMGWYMVKSGLVDNPHVSHYRLAAHLFLAFIIFAYLFWIFLDLLGLGQSKSNPPQQKLFYLSLGITALVSLQVIYGAFTAGLKAGYGFNTFPTMNGQWIPDGLNMLSPFWHNLVESNIGVQFIHRTIAWVLVLVIPGFYLYALKKGVSGRPKRALQALLLILAVQFFLGILTLIKVVPISLASAHQIGAFVLFAIVIWVNHCFSVHRNQGQI